MDDTHINFEHLSAREIDNIVDKGLRHRSGVKPADYLAHWLKIARHFGYATHDDSWGEFEKEFAIIIKRLVVAERELEALKVAKPAPTISALAVEAAVGGAYDMGDGRQFWVDAPVAREIARRVTSTPN